MAILSSSLALLCWAVLAILLILIIRTRNAAGLVRCIALLCILFYQLWFYFPQTNLFPASEYAQVRSVHIVIPAQKSGMREPTEAQSAETLAICNRLYASRSAMQTIKTCSGGAQFYVYFSGLGADGSRTNLTCGSSNNSRVKLNGQSYHI